MKTWLISFFWGNIIIFAEVLKWLAAKKIMEVIGKVGISPEPRSAGL